VGALLLVGTMTGAVLAHLVLLGGSPLPALVLGGFAGIILWGRWGTAKEWLGGRIGVPGPAVAAQRPGSV
jgi:hypothetical protein